MAIRFQKIKNTRIRALIVPKSSYDQIFWASLIPQDHVLVFYNSQDPGLPPMLLTYRQSRLVLTPISKGFGCLHLPRYQFYGAGNLPAECPIQLLIARLVQFYDRSLPTSELFCSEFYWFWSVGSTEPTAETFMGKLIGDLLLQSGYQPTAAELSAPELEI